ncbi:hypothetical protein BMS3Bbin11_00457 [bacterium BMS3Bbin11]|nr:hypothetical protein BMS3Bbin11_00457 [bacterium BMS3Bbin11]
MITLVIEEAGNLVIFVTYGKAQVDTAARLTPADNARDFLFADRKGASEQGKTNRFTDGAFTGFILAANGNNTLTRDVSKLKVGVFEKIVCFDMGNDHA